MGIHDLQKGTTAGQLSRVTRTEATGSWRMYQFRTPSRMAGEGQG